MGSQSDWTVGVHPYCMPEEKNLKDNKYCHVEERIQTSYFTCIFTDAAKCLDAMNGRLLQWLGLVYREEYESRSCLQWREV